MRQLRWIDADGGSTPLNVGGDIETMPGVQVAGMPPIRASVLTVPLQAGGRWQQVDHAPREVAVPVAVNTATLDELEAVMDNLTFALDPTRGDGHLEVTRHDGSTRDLDCRYMSALQVVETKAFEPVWRGLLVFQAVDPYWYDSFESSFTAAPGDAPGFFPFFPLRLGASEASVAGSIVNSGHVKSWPVWTITGPTDSVVATNVTTGESFTLNYELAAGEQVIIDTRPGVKTVTSDVSGDQFGALTDGSSLWALAVGTNAVEVTMTDSTEDSLVDMRWRRRWLTG